MNKDKINDERRKMLNKIRHTSLSGSRMNDFRAYESEKENHIRLKFGVWLKLRKVGYDVLCEAIFNNGIRFDLLAFKEGIWKGYEILSSETTKELSEKIKNYPDIEIIPIKSEEDIKNLEI